jgi:putative toxin-antitoxin system antitoxin component (TIGR02293 family)
MEQGAAVAVVREPEIPTEAFAEVVESAIKLMGSKERAMRWLGTPVPALNYATPISLLDKPEGKDAVLGVLHRAEYGVF